MKTSKTAMFVVERNVIINLQLAPLKIKSPHHVIRYVFIIFNKESVGPYKVRALVQCSLVLFLGILEDPFLAGSLS